MESKPFNIEIQLSDQNNKILTPLAVPDYSELKSATTSNKDFIVFDIIVKQNPVDKIAINIMQGYTNVFQAQLNSSMQTIGKHKWKWDGFNNAGIFDTKTLKQSNLSVEIVAQLNTNI